MRTLLIEDTARLAESLKVDLKQQGDFVDVVYPAGEGDEMVDVSTLRRKVYRASKQPCLETVIGRGCRFVERAETSDSPLTARAP